jgi:DNA polymerase III delta subunit
LMVANKNPAILVSALGKLLEQNMSIIAILRVLARYFMRLYQVKLKMQQNVPIDAAMQTLRPVVFFKQVNIFKSHLQHWSSGQLAAIIALLLNLEIKCKKTHNPHAILVEYELLKFISN